MKFTKFFIWEFVGLCFFATASAFYFTKGKTILFGILSLGTIILFYCRINLKKGILFADCSHLNGRTSLSSKNSYLLALFAGVIIYTLYFYSIAPVCGFPVIADSNIIFYSRISSFLRNTGIETKIIDYFNIANARVSPYHYFEIWLNSGLNSLFKNLSFLNFVLVVFPAGCFVVFLGICALIEQSYKLSVLNIILAFFLLFLKGVYLGAYSNIYLLKESSCFAFNLFNLSKLFPVYLVMILATIFFMRRYFFISTLVVLFLPIFTISAAPAILTGLFLVYIFLVIFKHYVKKNVFYAVAFVIFTGLFIYLFYRTLGVSNTHSAVLKDFFSSINHRSFREMWVYLKTFFNICIKTPLQILVLYFPFLVLIISYKNSIIHRRSSILAVYLLFLLTSLLSWAALNPMPDSVQLFYNIGSVIINLGISILLIDLVNSREVKNKYFSIFFIIFLLSFNTSSTLTKIRLVKGWKNHQYNIDFLTQVKKEFPGLNPIGGYLKHGNDYNTIFDKGPDSATLGQYLCLFSSDYDIVSLSVFEAPISDEFTSKKFEELMFLNSAFYQFVQNKIETNNFTSIDGCKFDFVKEKGIDFLITSRNAVLPENLSKLVQRKIIDSISGETFNILNGRKH
ncbi:MAG: hypothetical protein WC510_01120 [Candidatus Omnitrophota bacterium]